MKMILSNWWERYVANLETIGLWVALVLAITVFAWLGGYLVSVFFALVLAYLLDGMVKRLDKWKIPHLLSVSIVFLFSIGIVLVILFWLLPIIWTQLAALVSELPSMIKKSQALMLALPKKYPDFISANQIQNIMTVFQNDLTNTGKILLSYSVANLSSFLEIVVYFILVPLMVFFFLKDKKAILKWCEDFVPKRNNRLLIQVWHELNEQMGLYVRGKVFEVLIVSIVSAFIFGLMGLNYSLLLGALVGISAIVPFIGVILATIPVVIVAYMQWGWSMHFLYLVIVYTVITALDGNLLVPLLFSETMELHPVAVIIAIIVFGGLFGFWGVFFAIPLATVVRAIINALRLAQTD